MAAATRFRGPVRTGKDTGAPSTTTLSTLPAVRRISVSADGVYAVNALPPCDIIRAWLNTDVAWEASSGNSSTIMLGTSANQNVYGAVVVSGVGTRDVALSANCIGLVSGLTLIVNVTTAGTAGVGKGQFYIEYLQAED